MSFTAVLYLLAFMSGCVLAFARHPIYGLVTYVGVFYLNPPTRWWGQGLLHDVRWSQWAAAITLLAVLLKRSSDDSSKTIPRGPIITLLLFVAWLWIQSFWAIDAEQHSYFLGLYAKFAVVLYLIYKCVDSERNLQFFVWAHILGCFYFGWIAFTSYTGGRFEEFGGAGLSEANTAALQLLTGVFAASACFLVGGPRTKALLLALIPFILNGIVTTASRSAFLAILVGGITFNLATPRTFKRSVKVLSVLAAVLFLMLAGPTYWARMDTIKYGGEEVEGVETGASRVAVLHAQIRMVRDYPMGCGHQCTGALSPRYVEQRFLSKASGERSSHNTLMSMWVDHGPPGLLLYVTFLVWLFVNLRLILKRLRNERTFLAVYATGVAASFAAMVVSDQFVPITRLEVRIWLVGTVLVLRHMIFQADGSKSDAGRSMPATADAARPRGRRT